MACRIVFEDDFIIVADKPAGLLTVPTPKNEKDDLEFFIKGLSGSPAGPGNIGVNCPGQNQENTGYPGRGIQESQG